MASSKYTRHVPIDVHLHHLIFRIAKHLTHISRYFQYFSSLLDQINIDGAMLATKYVDFRLIEQPFLDLLLTTHFLKLQSLRSVKLQKFIVNVIEEIQGALLTVDFRQQIHQLLYFLFS